MQKLYLNGRLYPMKQYRVLLLLICLFISLAVPAQTAVTSLHGTVSDQSGAVSRSGAVDGARSDQSNVSLDGVDGNDQNKGYAFSGVLRATRDSVEEFRVVTTNSNADSGYSSGAQVSLVTRTRGSIGPKPRY